MRIAPHTKRQVRDLISEIVGDRRYATPYYPPGLTAETVGPQSRVPVGVTRYYFLATPPVIVDFEPSPLDDVPQMFCEQKRRWAHRHGAVYVPIFLREKLTAEEFRARLTAETEALQRAQSHAGFDWAMSVPETQAPAAQAAAPNPDGISDEEFNRLVDEEALLRLEVEVKYRRYAGYPKYARLKKIRREVEAEFFRKLRDGSLGRYLRTVQSAVPAR